MTNVYFAIPGDINTRTGGYAYDRRLIAELHLRGCKLKHLPLSNKFPTPDAPAIAETETLLAQLPEGAVVIIDGLAFGVMAELAERHQHRLRLIALCHHPLMLEAGLSSEQVQSLFHSEQRALNAAQAVIVTSAMTRSILIEQFAIPAAKISVAEPGTDRQNFARCGGNPPVLLTIATLTRRKAHDVLIDALAQVQHLPWTARFAGGMDFDLEWSALLHQKVKAYGLEERIIFTGMIIDTAREYAAADVFVLPSLFEGYGMAFAEALSFGLPVIAARAGAVADLVPATAGILVPPGDVAALADALQKLLTNPNLHAQLQRGAQTAALQLPTWTDTAKVVADVITQGQTQPWPH